MVISFTKVSLPYGWLGNMAPFSVNFEGNDYRTTEALFQALRFKELPEIQELIRAEKSPMGAKMVAKKHIDKLVNFKLYSKEDIDNMRFCIDLKLEQHPKLKDLLLETDEMEIIENCSSRPRGSGLFWGASSKDGQWIGENMLGKIWMDKRQELRKSLKDNQKIKI